MENTCLYCKKKFESEYIINNEGMDFCHNCHCLNVNIISPKQPLDFGDYLLYEKIGYGANAVVVKAKHKQTKDIVTLKLFFSNLSFMKHHSTKEFLAEIELASQLTHKNIVQIYEGGEEQGILYLVLEYVNGVNLLEYLELYGALEENDALAIMKHVCYALDYVWSNFLMVHRDIKPQNIMLTSRGKVKLCDFGLILEHEQSFDEYNIVGTPYYLAPEVINKNSYQDHRSDLYSLAATMFHLVSNTLPFDGNSMKEVLYSRLDKTPILKEITPNISQGFSDILKTMMQIDPEDRYLTGADVSDDLIRLSKNEQPILFDKNKPKLNQ